MQDLGNASHQQIDDVIEVSPWAIDSFWASCLDEVKGVNLSVSPGNHKETPMN